MVVAGLFLWGDGPLETIMQKAIENFLFGLCFGMGFAIAQAVLHFIGSFMVKA